MTRAMRRPSANVAVMAWPASPNPAAAATGEATETHSGSTWKTASRLLRFAIGVDRRAFFGTVAIYLTGSLAEGAGLVLLLPLLSAAGMNFGGSTAAGRLGTDSQHLLVRLGIPHALWLPVVLGIFLLVG